MQKNISSAQTFLMKMIFPPLWILLFGSGTIMLWTGGFDDPRQSDTVEMKLLFLVMWIAGTSFILWICAPLKRVRLHQRDLYISNYFKEIKVPLASISDVTENRWINIHPVTIHFKNETQFGKKVTFMPTARLLALMRSHPIVQELRAGAGLRAT
jgi:hypothetical protein